MLDRPDILDWAAAFGPILKAAFPAETAARRMAVGEALGKAVMDRQSWFSPALTPSPLSDPHPLGQEYDGDALREAAIEECAKVADNWNPGRKDRVTETGIAEAIRALSATPPAQEGEGAKAVRDDECNVEFGTVPDCDCPHEHWHVGGVCLDVHIEEDGSGHAILGNDDWQLEVKGVSNLDEMRAIAFGWASQKYGFALATPAPTVDETDRLREAWPAGLTQALREILGIPNFQCGPMAHAYQKIGEFSGADGLALDKRAEDEQAFILHKLIGFWFEHGDGWREPAIDEIDRAAKLARAALSDRPQAGEG